ncbi:85/88 kDa calcium-independent phospholipase A2-like [Babylonia areolata]|uniref:85/88 kDa calcium-independent phospholipase A2-like n=1 Tax=Babylonia areolata TaxID=304850 RepID=UPI003FD3299F
MAGLFKQLTTTVGGMINMAQATISPFKVQQVDFETFQTSQMVQQNECMYLFKKPGLSECVMASVGPAKKNYSLFRQTNEVEARLTYELLCKTMMILGRCCAQHLTEDVLQKLCDCCRDRQTWNVVHIAAFIGFHVALEQKELHGLINSACPATHVTPLMASVLGKQPLSLETLLRHGASVTLVDKQGNTVYHLALIYCPLVITVLKDYDKSSVINLPNFKGETPLFLACQMKVPEAVEVLIEAGADPSHSNTSTLPIHAAVSAGDIRSVEAIIEKHPDQKDAKDAMGRIPLHHACSEEMVSKLSMMGCNMNVKNADGETPLLLVMREKRNSCILSLLCHGADCNVQDGEGETVLHKAVREDNVELVRTFIVFNADPNVRNVKNQSPRHLATISDRMERELILYLLHVSGAQRCTKEVKGCLAGCVAEGSHNGVPDKAMSTLMKLDSVAMFDELLSATGSGKNATVTNSSGSVLDMVDIPSNIGDRVLSLDGGGIRGLVLIQMLMEIEAAVGKPIRECFDWIGGTSTGGILALGIGKGFPLSYIKGLYVRMKDEVFKGSRPYNSALFEAMLKREFGETSVMSDIKSPKVMVTATLADKYPAALHIFRNYEQPFEEPHSDSDDSKRFPLVTPPDEQLIWETARSTGAAPTYFRAFGRFMDGGLMANNPTLDMITEVHEYNVGLRLTGQDEKVKPLGCVVSLGTGRIPVSDVKNVDVFRPEGILDAYRAVSGALSLSRMLIDQASVAEGRVVDRARAWCSMLNVPHFRFSPQLSEDVALDCHNHATLINMMWETHCYMVANRHRVHELANLLRATD